MSASHSAATEPDERVLVITRVFDAPRERVFEAWTEPKQLAHWAAPLGFTIMDSGGELRPGGAWYCRMRSPDGVDHRNGGIYRDIVAPARLAYTFAWEDATGQRGHETLVTITFAEEDGKTRVTFRQGEFESQASRDGHHGGWSESFERLTAFLATR